MAGKALSDKELLKRLGVDAAVLARFRQIQKETISEAKRAGEKRKGKIRVLGVSGSSRDEFDMAQESSNSEALLNECLAECRKLGAETELVPLRKFTVKPCKACYSTVNTQCHFYCSCYPKDAPTGDDMSNKLYDKILAADVIVLATPVNNFKISTLMAAFIDRCISLDGSLPPANPKKPKDKALNRQHMRFIELTADEGIPGSGLHRRFLGKIAGVIVAGHEAGASLSISQLFLTLNHYGMLFPPFGNMYATASVCQSTDRDKPVVLSECYVNEARLLARNVMTAARRERGSGTRATDWKYDYTAN